MLQEEGRVSLGSQPEPPESNDLSNLAPPDMTDTIDGKSILRYPRFESVGGFSVNSLTFFTPFRVFGLKRYSFFVLF